LLLFVLDSDKTLEAITEMIKEKEKEYIENILILQQQQKIKV
jgi:hypothetical protein